MMVFGAIALIFNPIIPIYLKKETWILIDIISSMLFFYSNNLLNKGGKNG
jgi:hypothetical protein